MQYVADNADHNVRTLDGKDTFHGMGMIAVVTPGTKNSNQILRVKITSKDIAAVGRVPVYYYREDRVGMHALVFEKLQTFTAEDTRAHLDVLWKSSTMFGTKASMVRYDATGKLWQSPWEILCHISTYDRH